MQGTIEGQLGEEDIEILTSVVREAQPDHILEIGTWKGGGSTLHFLQQLHKNGKGQLWGIEACDWVFQEMQSNITQALPEASKAFIPLFGYSNVVIPKLLAERGPDFQFGVVFLDGGNNPGEQIEEFELLHSRIPVGGYLLSHDATCRKGKWFVPFIKHLDNWCVEVRGGMLKARKLADAPSPENLKAAQKELRRLQWEPLEIINRYTPASLRKKLSTILPTRIVHRLAHGWR